MESEHQFIDVTFSATRGMQHPLASILSTISSSLSRVLSRDGDPHVEFLEDGQVLKVKSVRLRDQGLYQCLASNNAGTQMRQFRLTVQGLCFTSNLI